MRVRRGTNSFEMPLDLRYAELPESERDVFPWFRPRHRLNALTAPTQLYDYYNPEARSVVRPTGFVIR